MSGPPSQMTSASCVAEAEAALAKCLSLGADSWLVHMVRGALACCRFEWKKAAAAFESALKIASQETRSHFWYIAFLIATGRVDEAAECVKLRQSHSDPLLDPESYTIDAALQYAQGEFEGAHTLLSLMLIKRVNRPHFYVELLDGEAGSERIDLRNWVAETLMACILLSTEMHDPPLATPTQRWSKARLPSTGASHASRLRGRKSPAIPGNYNRGFARSNDGLPPTIQLRPHSPA